MRSSLHAVCSDGAATSNERDQTCQHSPVGAVRQQRQRRDEREGFDICVELVTTRGGLVLVVRLSTDSFDPYGRQRHRCHSLDSDSDRSTKFAHEAFSIRAFFHLLEDVVGR